MAMIEDQGQEFAYPQPGFPCAFIDDECLNKPAFKDISKDCFLPVVPQIELPQINCDATVPDVKLSSPTIVICHHFHHLLPMKPVLLAPPLMRMTNTMAAATPSNFYPTISGTVPCSNISLRVKDPHNAQNQQCSHCSTSATSLWRRVNDRLMCNACALYFKLHGFDRPLHLNTGVIKRRNRIGASSQKRYRRYKC